MPSNSQFLKSKAHITTLMTLLGALAAAIFALAIPGIYLFVSISETKQLLKVESVLLVVLSSLLGLFIFFIFRTYPIRMLENILNALQESQAKYYDLYENAPDMYYSADLETGAIRECNETFLRITGYSREEVIGRPIFDFYDAGSREEHRKLFQQFPMTGELRDVERRVKCKDGRIIEVSLNVSSVRDKEGKIIYTRAIWHDITRRKKYEELIQALAITDQLTGLYNRRGLMTLAEQQLKMAERTKESLLLFFADLDDLKKINDQLGHKAGDEAIVDIANILREVFRKVDIISRIGGDEFAVLATEASLEYGDLIRKRLQDQLALHNGRAGRAFDISISVGMAYYDPENPCSLDELITRADSIMYEEKVRKKAS